MMTARDLQNQMSAVERSVGTRTIAEGEARVLTLAQRFDAPPEEVWAACTGAERIPQWFMPVSGELRAGGRYQFEGNAGGTIEACEAPHAFRATWEFGGDVTRIAVRVRPEADGTRFELEHTAIVAEERWAQYGPGATGVGWDLGLLGLALHLATGKDIPAESAEWIATPEASAFTAALSNAWAEASIAAGTPAADARAAGERTTAFYTGA